MLGKSDARRATEAVSDLSADLRSQAQDMAALRAQVARLRATVRALWAVLSARLNLEEADLIKALEAAEETERSAPAPTPPCPRCSRPLQANSSVCIYCGAKVERRVLF